MATSALTAALLTAGVLSTAGCANGSPSDVSGASADTPSGSGADETVRAREATSHTGVNAGDVSLDTTLPRLPTAAPQQSSGELTSADLPLASALGPGWAVRVEGADVDGEDGVGNGTAFQERDPDEVVETTIPMGCEVRSASPVPGNVLQATYTHRQSGAYAVILRMRFATADDARAFARVRETDLQACVDQPDDPYSGDPAPVRSVEARAGQTASTYTQVGERQTWYSLARVEGRDVVTLDADPPNPVLVTWQAVGYEAP